MTAPTHTELYGLPPASVADLYALVGGGPLERGSVAADPTPAVHLDEAELYGLDEGNWLYGLAHFEHQACVVGEYCRNPLHPGPCKGWKHMLHSVAPGAYHAYEQQRVAKLNEARKARIAELQKAGQPVPKHLLKEITYRQVPTKPAGTPFVAPTKKQAEAALPATAKEIAEKIAMKHAGIAQAKGDKAKMVDGYLSGLALLHPEFMSTPERIKHTERLKAIIGDADSTPEQVAEAKKLLDKIAIPGTLPAKAEAGKVSGPLAHPDMMHLVDLVKDNEKSPAMLAKAAQGPNVNKEELAKLPQAVQDKIKAALTQAHDTATPGGTAHGKLSSAHEKLFGEKLHEVPVPPAQANTAEEASVASKPGTHKDVTALVDAAGAAAGRGSGTGALENLIIALKKPAVTKEAVAALPPAVQESLKQSLTTAARNVGTSTKTGQNILSQVDALFGEEKKSIQPSVNIAHAVVSLLDAEDAVRNGNDHLLPMTKTLHHLGQADVTKEQFEALPAKTQQRFKEFLAKHHAEAPASVDNIAHKLGIQVEKPAAGAPSAPGPVGSLSSPGKKFAPENIGPETPAHIVKAMGYASGTKYGTATTKLTAYSKLSKEEFNQLPEHTQKKIIKDLMDAKEKFLDPKKQNQILNLLDRWHTSEEVLAGPKPGTSGHSQMVAQAHIAALKLGGVIPTTKDMQAIEQHYAGSNVDIPEEAVSLANLWHSEHIAPLVHSGALSEDDSVKIMDKAEAEIKTMLQQGQMHAPIGGVLHEASEADDEPFPSAGSKAYLLKQAVGIKSGGAGAGGSSVAEPAPVKVAQAKLASEHHAAYVAAAQLAGGQGKATKVQDFQKAMDEGKLDELIKQIAEGVGKMWVTEKGSNLGAADKAKVPAEIEQMIKTGQTQPPKGSVLAKVAAGPVPAGLVEEGQHPAGSDIHGLTTEKKTTVTAHPLVGMGHLQQVIATGQTAKVKAYNAKVLAAAAGDQGHMVAPLSISKLANMADKKLGTVSATSARKSLTHYSGSGYQEINDHLRAIAKGQKVSDVTEKKIRPMVEAMDAAFGHSHMEQATVVHRGIKSGMSGFDGAWQHDHSMVGAVVSDPGYASSSTAYTTASSFAGHGGIVMRVLVPKGYPGISMHGGNHSGENEILLPRGTKFRIVADNGWQNGQRHLDVEIIP